MLLFRNLLLLACLTLLSLPVMTMEPEGKIPPVKVITSIKPLQLIVAAITDGINKPDVLLDPSLSPHSYSMKPSDIHRLTEATTIFWLGPALERFLEKPLEQVLKKRNKQQRIIALMEAPETQLRKWSDETRHHGHDEHTHHSNIDAHIWLSPGNAIAMGKEVASVLSSVDSSNAVRYRDNLATFIERVKAADLANDKDLAVVRQYGFFVFHDAWGYLADHYGLTVKDVFALSPDRQPGARHLIKLKNSLKMAGHTCIFREPQFKPAYIDRLTDGLDVGEAVLDPMAGDIPVSASGYPQFLRHLGKTIAHCLSDNH